MTPRKRIWPASLALVVLSAAATAAIILYLGRALMQAPSAERAAYTAQTEHLPELWPAPDFDFENQHGGRTKVSDLRGRPWIANFIFTTCTTVCPRITASTLLVQRDLAASDVAFVSFSVDPKNDTPEVMKGYADRWGADPRWLLLRPQTDQVNALAAGMRVVVEPSDDPQNPIVHTSMLFLVDQRGIVRGVYDSADEGKLRQLARDVRELLGTDRGSAAAVHSEGAALYAKLGCAACHDDARLAPPLGGLVGMRRPLEGGAEASVDAAYLSESIVSPSAKIARGYLTLMPSYRGHLDDAALATLVEYVASLPPPQPAVGAEGAAAPGPTSGDAALAIDPVCKMQVRVGADTPHATHAGKEYHFCATICRDRFVAKPNEFLQPEAP